MQVVHLLLSVIEMLEKYVISCVHPSCQCVHHTYIPSVSCIYENDFKTHKSYSLNMVLLMWCNRVNFCYASLICHSSVVWCVVWNDLLQAM